MTRLWGAALLGLLAGSVYADDADFYAAASIVEFNYLAHDPSGLVPDISGSPSGARLNFGYVINSYLAVEGSGDIGLGDGNATLCASACNPVNIKLMNGAGAYLRGAWRYERGEVYIRGGAAQDRIQRTVLESTDQSLVKGLAFGAGLAVWLNDRQSLFVDWGRINGTDTHVSTIGLGYRELFSFWDRH